MSEPAAPANGGYNKLAVRLANIEARMDELAGLKEAYFSRDGEH